VVAVTFNSGDGHDNDRRLSRVSPAYGLPTPTPSAGQSSAVGKGWSFIPTAITKTAAGDLHVELAARMHRRNWSSDGGYRRAAELMAKETAKKPVRHCRRWGREAN